MATYRLVKILKKNLFGTMKEVLETGLTLEESNERCLQLNADIQANESVVIAEIEDEPSIIAGSLNIFSKK